MKSSWSKSHAVRHGAKPAMVCFIAFIIIGLAAFAPNAYAQSSFDYTYFKQWEFTVKHDHSEYQINSSSGRHNEAANFGWFRIDAIGNKDGNFTAIISIYNNPSNPGAGSVNMNVKGSIKLISNTCNPARIFSISFTFDDFTYEGYLWDHSSGGNKYGYFAGTYSYAPPKQPVMGTKGKCAYGPNPFCGDAALPPG